MFVPLVAPKAQVYPLPCIFVPSVKELRPQLQGRGTDFWVGSLADVSREELPAKIATMRVEDMLVSDVFTQCFACTTRDIKGDANVLIDEFGLGLRKMRCRSKDVPGCVFVLVKDGGPSALRLKYDGLQSADKRLSTEERVRRTNLRMDVVPQSRLEAEAGRGAPFWLSAFTDCDTEACKKRVVTMVIEGFRAEERFGRVLIAATTDCASATESITDVHGLSLRKKRVRGKPLPGCLVLLLEPMDPSLALSAEARTDGGSGLILPIEAQPSSSSARKRDAASSLAGASAAAVDPSPKRLRTAPSPGPAPAPAAGTGSAPAPHSLAAVNPEELHFKQICVIEKRLATLLPTRRGRSSPRPM